MYQQLKDESPVPSALHSLSDFDLSEKSSLGSPEHRPDLEGQHSTLALLPNKFPPGNFFPTGRFTGYWENVINKTQGN